MIDRLSALLASQKEFIAHAAHELRSPLTLLYGELTLVSRRPRDADVYRQAIDEALDATRRLKALAEDLLTLARIGASSPEDGREEVLTRKVVEESARVVAGEAAARGVDLHIDGDARAINGRRQDLERLFRNLLENAVRHSPQGGRVAAEVGEDDGAVIITVTDDGPGVDESDRDRIFEPFYRGPREAAENRPGTGLGLAIARSIARSHGGDLTLTPGRQGGAQFVVRLAA
jgi:signal transduction histidine kinase